MAQNKSLTKSFQGKKLTKKEQEEVKVISRGLLIKAGLDKSNTDF